MVAAAVGLIGSDRTRALAGTRLPGERSLLAKRLAAPKSRWSQIGRIFAAMTAGKIRTSAGNVYIGAVEADPVTTGRERPVREVKANEFDRKSLPGGSLITLPRADARFTRGDRFAAAKAKVTRAPRLRRSLHAHHESSRIGAADNQSPMFHSLKG